MIGRELVYSRRYDANRERVDQSGLYIYTVLLKKLSKKVLEFGRNVQFRGLFKIFWLGFFQKSLFSIQFTIIGPIDFIFGTIGPIRDLYGP